MRFSINSRTSGKYSEETINGRNHIVTTMMPIRGDIAMNKVFYPNAEVKKSFMQLNNLPAPNGHPKLNGVHVTAFSPLAMNAFNVGGFIRNPKMKGKEVFTDFVIDETVANTSDDGREIIRRIKEGEKIGVSTGLNINEVTQLNGKDDLGADYDRTGAGFNFDHVAILLNEKAAGDHAGTEMILNTADKDDPIYVVNMDVNDISMSDIRDQLHTKIQSIDDDVHRWVIDVFPESHIFIWEENQNRDQRLFKQSYSVGENDEVSIIDIPVRVKLNREYLTTTNQEDDEMNKDILILSIIANANNAFTNDDKERLTAMNESDLVSALCAGVDEKEAKKLLTANGYDFAAYDNFTANADAFKAFQDAEEKRLADIRESITSNSDYDADMLKGKNEAELLTINKLIEGKPSKRAPEGTPPSKVVNNSDASYEM